MKQKKDDYEHYENDKYYDDLTLETYEGTDNLENVEDSQNYPNKNEDSYNNIKNIVTVIYYYQKFDARFNFVSSYDVLKKSVYNFDNSDIIIDQFATDIVSLNKVLNKNDIMNSVISCCEKYHIYKKKN